MLNYQYNIHNNTYSYQVLYIYYFLLECTKHYDFAINIGTYNVISQLCIPEVYLFLEKKPIHALFLDFCDLTTKNTTAVKMSYTP